ncbi:MAG: hypothetical protein J0M28_15970 [Thauera sp.]|nr:hypothetical protein [Thauera sp.]
MLESSTQSGLYLVTLNNDVPISVNADDRRLADRAIKVRRGNLKVGKAVDLVRRHRNYTKTFGSGSVNFHILAYVSGGKGDLQRVEKAVLEGLAPFRIRGQRRLTEWLGGVGEPRAREVASEALRRSGVEYVLASEGAQGSMEVQKIQSEKGSASMVHPLSCAPGHDSTRSSLQSGTYAGRSIELMSLLIASGLLTDPLFRSLHHSGTGLRAHRTHCEGLVENGSDFARGKNGEKNRRVCRRLELIADQLGRLNSQVNGEEFDELVQYALREYPLETAA